MALVELRTLGDCQIVVGEERIGPQSPYAFALTLYLAVERGRPHPRDALLPIFFPGVAEGNAAHSLRQTLYKLRQLGVPAETTRAGVILRGPDVRDDYSALVGSGELPDAGAERLPGDFLPGYWPKVSDEFTRWLDAQRDVVNSALRRALVSRILDRRAVARWDEVERFARSCLAIDPLNEEATLALAEALALSGSKAAGVKVLERYLEEVGEDRPHLALPATVMRRRIAERVHLPEGRPSEPPLIGRETQLQTLSLLVAESRAGQPRSAIIWGEAGIGKTRLVREFTSSLQLSGARVLEAQCQPHDVQRPWSLLVDLAPQLLRLPGAMGADPQSVRLLQQVHIVDSDDSPTRPRIKGDGPDEIVALMTDALSDVVDAIATTTYVVLIIDDAHWIDPLSRRILGHIVAERKRRRVLLLVTSRDQRPLLDTVGTPTYVHLPALTSASSTALARSILSQHIKTIDEALLTALLSQSSGNPFYIRTLCDVVIANGSLANTPPILRDILTQRLGTLSTTGRTVFTMCAVLGRLASVKRVAEGLGLPTHQLAAALAELEGMGLIVPKHGRLDVQHALLASSLFQCESTARVAVVRRAAALVLEAEAQSSGEIALLWEAADHWVACGEPIRAKKALKTSSLHAARMGAAAEALHTLAKYAAVASDDEALAVCEAIRENVLKDSRLGSNLVSNWRQMPPGEAPSKFATSFELLTVEVSRHQHGDGELHIERLRSLLDDPYLSWKDRVRAGSAAMCIAEDINDDELAHHIVTTLAVTSPPSDSEDADTIRLWLVYHTAFGDSAKALALAGVIARWSDRQIQEGDAIRTFLNAALCHMYLGQIDTARRQFARAFGVSSAQGNETQCVIAAANAALLERQCGSSSDVGYWIARIAEYAENSGLRLMDTLGVYTLLLHALDCGDRARAEEYITEIGSRVSFYSRSSHWAMFAAAKLRIAGCAEDSVLSGDDIDAAAEWCLRAAPRSPCDDVALAVTTALSVLDPPRGSNYVNRYLRARRSGLPILPALSSLAAATT